MRLRGEVDDRVDGVRAQHVHQQVRAGLVAAHQHEVAEQRGLAQIAAQRHRGKSNSFQRNMKART